MDRMVPVVLPVAKKARGLKAYALHRVSEPSKRAHSSGSHPVWTAWPLPWPGILARLKQQYLSHPGYPGYPFLGDFIQDDLHWSYICCRDWSLDL